MHFRKGVVFLLLTFAASADSTAREISLDAFETIEMPAARSKAPTNIELRAFGRVFKLELSSNTGLLAALPAGQRNRVARDDLFLQGRLSGVPDSWVRLNRIDGRFSGGFYDGTELYLIDDAGGLEKTRTGGQTRDETIVFRLSDLELPLHIDSGGVAAPGGPGTAASAKVYEQFVEDLREVATLQGNAMLALPLTIVSDARFTNRHGSNVTSVIAGRVNFIDGIYTNQLGIGIMLHHHEVLSGTDALDSADAPELLSQFRTFMTSGAGQTIPFEGLAHLITGKKLDGNTVGIAYMDVLCSDFAGYGLDQDLASETASALVLAHEVGHNFSAPHDGQPGSACENESFQGIMSGSLNGSQEFSDCSIDRISHAASWSSCLVDRQESTGVFTSSFEGSTR